MVGRKICWSNMRSQKAIAEKFAAKRILNFKTRQAQWLNLDWLILFYKIQRMVVVWLCLKLQVWLVPDKIKDVVSVLTLNRGSLQEKVRSKILRKIIFSSQMILGSLSIKILLLLLRGHGSNLTT